MVIFRRYDVLFFVLIMIISMARNGSSEKLLRVGDKKGWNPNINYTIWASTQHFYVNDWLQFVFNKHQYDVLEVNKTNYESCIDQNFKANVTKGGRDVYQLKEARDYYFISGRGGGCWGGMKLALKVEKTPPKPAPPPAKAASAPSVGISMLSSIFMVFITLSVSFKMY